MLVQSRGWEIIKSVSNAKEIIIPTNPDENNLIKMYAPLGQQCSYVYVFQNFNESQHIIVAIYEKSSMQTLIFRNSAVEFHDILTKNLRRGLARFFCSRPNHKNVCKQLKLKNVKLISQSNNRSMIGLLQQLQEITTQNMFIHKAGVLLQAKDQTTEEQIFNNVEGSAFYQQFLQILGDEVQIDKNFTGYLGGLDQQGRESAKSIYKTLDNHCIMYHVGTMMRQIKNDEQQVGKKRHIGNDNVVIIFQENDSPDYICDLIRSNMIFVVIVVRNLSTEFDDKNVKYKINITRKSFVKHSDFQLDSKYTEGNQMTIQEASDIIFKIVVKCMQLCWCSGELQIKLDRLKQMKIDEWQ